MSNRDELPAKIGHRKQALREFGNLRRYRHDGQERIRRKVGRFLLRQVGRRWADVRPEVDALLRVSRVDEYVLAEFRSRLHRELEQPHSRSPCLHTNGSVITVCEHTGVLVVEPTQGTREQATFSAAELRRQPQRITN